MFCRGLRSRISTSLGIVERSHSKSSLLLFNWMKRVVLLSTTTGYQADAFLRAARALGVEVILGTDRCHVLEDPWGDGAIALKFDHPEGNAEILAGHSFDGLVAIGDAPAETAALAACRLGSPFHSTQGAQAARDQLRSRGLLAAA